MLRLRAAVRCLMAFVRLFSSILRALSWFNSSPRVVTAGNQRPFAAPPRLLTPHVTIHSVYAGFRAPHLSFLLPA